MYSHQPLIKLRRTLVQAFPEAGIGVAVAMDGVLYETDVLAASNVSPYHHLRHTRMGTGASSPASKRTRGHRHNDNHRQSMVGSAWGQRPVLVLIGVRLGISGVNPIYYDAVKVSFFPDIPLFFQMNSTALGALYIPSNGWHRRWTPVLVLLFRWFSGRQSLLSGSPPYPSHHPIPTTSIS